MRPSEPQAVNLPAGLRTVDVYEAELAIARKDIKRRAKMQDRYGLVVLGETPMERRRNRQAQLLGTDNRLEKNVEREIERLRHEHRLERAATPADKPATEEEVRRHEAFLAAEAAEEAEENRKRIAKANRAKFTKDEHGRRYGKEVQYRSGGGGRSMKDLTTEEDKRSYLKSLHDDFTALGGIVGTGKRTGTAAGSISMHKFAIEHNLSPETVRQSLLTWEALVDIHDRTGRWPQVRRARFAIMQGWRAGDPFPFPDKVKNEKVPKDLVDIEPPKPLDLGKVNMPTTEESESELVHSKMIYSESYKRRHGG